MTLRQPRVDDEGSRMLQKINTARPLMVGVQFPNGLNVEKPVPRIPFEGELFGEFYVKEVRHYSPPRGGRSALVFLENIESNETYQQ